MASESGNVQEMQSSTSMCSTSEEGHSIDIQGYSSSRPRPRPRPIRRREEDNSSTTDAPPAKRQRLATDHPEGTRMDPIDIDMTEAE